MTDNQKREKGNNNSLNSYARFSSIAIQMFVIIGIGTFGGIKLDEYFQNTNNLFTIILSSISVILSILYVVWGIISSSKDKE